MDFEHVFSLLQRQLEKNPENILPENPEQKGGASEAEKSCGISQGEFWAE